MPYNNLTTSQIKCRLDALLNLSNKLQGHCGNNCPIHIYSDNQASQNIWAKTESHEHKSWNCNHCKEYFHFIRPNNVKYPYTCPCIRAANPEEVILALEEQIQDFKNALSTRWED